MLLTRAVLLTSRSAQLGRFVWEFHKVIPVWRVRRCVAAISLLFFPASGSFLMNQLFASSGQSIGASVSLSVLSKIIQDLISFRIDWFDFLAIQGTLKSLL